MSITIADYCNVIERANELGLNEPQLFAILPRNFLEAKNKAELYHESSAPTIKVLFRQNGIEMNRIEQEGDVFPCMQENEFSLILPTIFVGSLILSQDPHAIAFAINVLSNYATDFFKGIPGRNKVSLSIVVENKKGVISKKISYTGGVEGLKELPEIVGKIYKDNE